ncbi:hypothetical protein B0H19DRAFT_1261293 [Mycena capillaripes]|nr:hypothetical protein B0H19DRAFT_1261293 [Mycena capillaripes]
MRCVLLIPLNATVGASESVTVPPNNEWTSYTYRNNMPSTSGNPRVPNQVGNPTSSPLNKPNIPPAWSGRRPAGYGGGSDGGDDDNGGPGRGFNGPDQSGGGGHGGDGGGGGAGGHSSGVRYPSPLANYWQINHKLSVSIVPEWNGMGNMLIDYVSSMSNLAAMGIELANDLAQIALSKFKDRAKRWWDSLPLEKRTSNSMSWANLLGAIRRHFLTAKWLLERERPLMDWPRGRTVNGYHFKRDDSKGSAVLPNGECYICTSPKHVARDCPHYGAFVSYKQANYIQIDWDEEDEAKETEEYLAMHVKSNKNPSAYPLESPKILNNASLRPASFEGVTVKSSETLAKSAYFVVQGFHRNRRRQERFEREKASQREHSSKDELDRLIKKLGKSADNKESQDPPADPRRKGKRVSGDGMEEPVIVPRRVARRSSPSHVAELPSMRDAEG